MLDLVEPIFYAEHLALYPVRDFSLDQTGIKDILTALSFAENDPGQESGKIFTWTLSAPEKITQNGT